MVMEFDLGSSSDEDDRLRYMKLKKSLALKKKELENVDDSLYMYDEVYDSMKGLEINNDRMQKKDSSRYITNLISAKSEREADKLTTRENKFKLELERDKHLYEGKEEFVSSSYKAYQEEKLSVIALSKEDDTNQKTLLQRFLEEEEIKHQRAVELSMTKKFVKDEVVNNNEETESSIELPAGLNIVSNNSIENTRSVDVVRQARKLQDGEGNTPKRSLHHSTSGIGQPQDDPRESRAQRFEELLQKTKISEGELSEYRERYWLRHKAQM